MDARTMYEHRVFRWLLLGIAFAVLSGCSTLAGEKLGEARDGKQIAPTGVPYSLVRPEYTIARTPPAEGAKKASYTLAVTYEPDANQRYTIRLDPALFSDPDFLLKLSTSGTVVGTTAKATEQISTTITAIGQFAASVAKAGIFDAFDTRAAIKAEMQSATAPATCTRVATTLQRPPYLEPSTPWSTVADAISARIDTYASDAEFSALFEYQTLDEKACLISVQGALADLSRHDPTIANDRWTKELAAFKGRPKDDSLFAEKIAKAVVATDEAILKKEQDANTNQPPPDGALAQDRDALISRALEAVRAAPAPQAATQLTAIIKMNTATWLARHVLYTEREMEQTSLYLLRNPGLRGLRKPDPQKDPVFQAEQYISRMRQERAATLGVTALDRRVDTLTGFLSSVPAQGIAPATAEFATARVELDAALAQIDIRRARVLADAKPPPITALPPTRVTPITRENMDKILKSGWTGSEQKGSAPELLMVLEEVK